MSRHCHTPVSCHKEIHGLVIKILHVPRVDEVDHFLDDIMLHVFDSQLPCLGLHSVVGEHGVEDTGGAGQDVAMNGDDLSLADDLEVAELAIQKLPNICTHCGLHQKLRVGDERIASR